MSSIYQRLYHSVFKVYERRDLREWEKEPERTKPLYVVYHVFCDRGWETIVERQIASLKDSGLLDAVTKLYVSCIAHQDSDVARLKEIIDSDKMEIISDVRDPLKFEYPALEFIYELSQKEDCLICYFHTKGISYQTTESNDRTFVSFKKKIVSWCRMMEYFNFYKWRVAVNALNHGYDTYGCYRWPPRNYKMFSGSFWWAASSYIKTLPPFDPDVIRRDRFYSETWLYERPQKDFSAFDTVADLYFVNIPQSVYADGKPRFSDVVKFVFTYNYRKMLKHLFGYNYKKRCQRKFQKINNK